MLLCGCELCVGMMGTSNLLKGQPEVKTATENFYKTVTIPESRFKELLDLENRARQDGYGGVK